MRPVVRIIPMLDHRMGKKKFLIILWDKDKVSSVKIKMEPWKIPGFLQNS